MEVLPWFGTTGFLLMSLNSAARDLLTTLMIGSSLLWEMMLWLSEPVILKNKAALDAQKGASLDLKCVRMRLAAGLLPDPLGKLERSPRPYSQWCSGAGTHRNAVPVNILGPERRSGAFRHHYTTG